MNGGAQPCRLVDQNGFTVATRGRGFSEITREVAELVAASGVQTGIAQVFTAHTSCSLLICENADPSVRGDLERWMARVVPDGDPMFRHDAEGPDDMPAHIRSALTATQLSVPVTGGRMALGTWQGLYVFEHRTASHSRNVVLHLLGE